ncbi:MAG TPA: response regulator [Vicinamibacteria bacterium]|jgi:CheY-like chemotaxis protein/anti-sigma regulatory factor (Ser/Thr protein kinase)|nr:response regulator [Vicinamibacteria bacterium]
MARILVAEDEASLSRVISEILESAGFEVATARDGVEALERLAQSEFDLLLTDIRMPRLDGLELLARIRDMTRRPRVIVLTSDAAPQTVLQAIREQALVYLTKPVHAAQLVSAVQEVLALPPPSHPIEVLSATPQWVELLLPCELAVADRIQGLLEHLETDLSEEVREAVGRVFRELLLNAIEWGGRLDPNRKVRVSYLRARKMLLYRIADPGPGFRLEGLTHAAIANPPDAPVDHAQVREEKGLRPGGLGVLIARSMADELIYNEARNEVVFVKYLT